MIRHLGDTHGPHVDRGCRHRWRSCWRCADGCRWCRGRLVAVILGVVAVKLFDLDAKGVEIVGPIDSGLPRIGLPEDRSFSDYLTAAGAAAGIMLVGFAEGLGAAKTYAARAHYEVDPNRELIGLGAANVGSGHDDRHGRQRQPVEDGGQRLGRRPLAGVRAGGGGVHRRHAAVPHRPVRGSAGGDAGGSRDRRRRRARRHRRAARLLRACTPAASDGSTAAPPGRTSSPRSRRCSACSCSTPSPGWSSASSCRCCCCCTGRLDRTSPSSAGCPERPTSSAMSTAIRRTQAERDVAVLRVESGLFFANAEAVREAVRQRADRAGVSRCRARCRGDGVRGHHRRADARGARRRARAARAAARARARPRPGRRSAGLGGRQPGRRPPDDRRGHRRGAASRPYRRSG